MNSETIDAVVEALGSARRRYVLYYVRDREEVTVDDLAIAVARWVAARSGDGPPGPRDHERARAALHHRDLPKLSEAGLVSSGEGAETVTVEESPLCWALLDLLLEHGGFPEVGGTDDAAFRGV